MGFKDVYETLKEIFPQLDERILKAVAIEHPIVVDAAINDVLVEVVPYLSYKTISLYSAPMDSSPGVLLEKGDVKGQEKKISDREQGMIQADPGNSEQRFVSFDDSDNNYYVPDFDKAPRSGVVDESQSEVLNFYDANDDDDAHFYAKVESTENGGIEACDNIPPPEINRSCEEIASETFEDVNIKTGAEQPLPLVDNASVVHENGIYGSLNEELASLSSTAMVDCDLINCERIHEVEPCLDSFPQRVNADSVSNEFDLAEEFDSEKPLHGSPVLTSKLYCYFTRDTEEKLISDSMDTRSDNSCKVEFLEEMIEAARTNKKALNSAMETVINKMKEVELREKAAEEAQKEAANGGLEITLKVEELKHMLVQAKEANNMHAGDVYGEKAILATEARELQSRLLNLSDERDDHLRLLDEMRQSLETRLATAETLRNVAEEEKMEKEEWARKALAEQEALMEKVVEESKMLQQEAEENSKLQEFLMDRGRIVDALQGEISVICQDVKLLKEKFDERIPFRKSLFSSQTSCILASSGSSQKSKASDSGSERDGSLNLDRRFDLEKAKNECEALEGDGWDLLDVVSEFDRC